MVLFVAVGTHFVFSIYHYVIVVPTTASIFKVQYTVIGNAFKEYALGRFYSKDFDADFDKQLSEFIDENSAVWVTEIDETSRKRIAKVIDNSYNDGLSTEETGTAIRNMIIGKLRI